MPTIVCAQAGTRAAVRSIRSTVADSRPAPRRGCVDGAFGWRAAASAALKHHVGHRARRLVRDRRAQMANVPCDRAGVRRASGGAPRGDDLGAAAGAVTGGPRADGRVPNRRAAPGFAVYAALRSLGPQRRRGAWSNAAAGWRGGSPIACGGPSIGSSTTSC
jgi:hypothetical protein